MSDFTLAFTLAFTPAFYPCILYIKEKVQGYGKTINFEPELKRASASARFRTGGQNPSGMQGVSRDEEEHTLQGWKGDNFMVNFHDRYDWLGYPEEDVRAAEDAIVNYDEEKDPQQKDFAFFGVQCAIAKALVEIRDELRIMNERSNDNGKA